MPCAAQVCHSSSDLEKIQRTLQSYWSGAASGVDQGLTFQVKAFCAQKKKCRHVVLPKQTAGRYKIKMNIHFCFQNHGLRLFFCHHGNRLYKNKKLCHGAIMKLISIKIFYSVFFFHKFKYIICAPTPPLAVVRVKGLEC